LLDAIVQYLPSPADIGHATGTDGHSGLPVNISADPQAAFCGLAFKNHEQ